MKKYLLGTTAIAIALSMSAFKVRSNTWVFQGNSSQILQASSYSMNVSEPSGCGAGANLPCSIQSSAADQPALQDFLDTKTSEQVRDLSENKRN